MDFSSYLLFLNAKLQSQQNDQTMQENIMALNQL